MVDAQPTILGRMLHALGVLADGRIMLGYGEWEGENTGPIDLLAVHPDTAVVSTLYNDAPTEAIREMKQLNDGWWWSASIDPRGTSAATLLTNAQDGTWKLVTVAVAGLPIPVHLFGVTQTSDDALYVCGSRRIMVSEGNTLNRDYGAAFVWKSVDWGVTWTEDLVYTGSGHDPYLRFYAIGQAGDNLCVVSSDAEHHWTCHEGVWTEHDGDLGGQRPTNVSTADKFATIGYPARLYSADVDGELVEDVATLGSTTLEVLAARDGMILRTALLTGVLALYNDEGVAGSISVAGSWTGAYAADGAAYVCDGTTLYSVD